MSGFFKPFVAGPARHFVRLMREPDYRVLAGLESRLGRHPRRRPLRVRAGHWTLEVPDAASFLASWREIVVDRRYGFPWSEARPPRILDLGANVGLSVLHFLALHPGADVTAVEADPELFGYLERNLTANGAGQVRRLQRAAWTGPGRLSFARDGADGGRVAANGAAPSGGERVEVEALDLPALLEAEAFDVLKMDIEGAELQVLPACREGLRRTRFVAVEYHSPAGAPQALSAVVGALEAAGFRVHVQSVNAAPQPFFGVRAESGFDLQLNVFAWRA